MAATAAVTSAQVVVTDAVASLAALEALLVEADVRLMEAKAELHDVQQQCAHGQAEGMALCFQRTLLQAMSEQQAKFLWDACMLQWGQLSAAGGAGLLLPPAAGAQQQPPLSF